MAPGTSGKKAASLIGIETNHELEDSLVNLVGAASRRDGVTGLCFNYLRGWKPLPHGGKLFQVNDIHRRFHVSCEPVRLDPFKCANIPISVRMFSLIAI